MSEQVDVQTHGAVACVVFRNPPSNFATIALMRGIADALARVDADPALRAVVLASEGKPFCAGADLVSPNGFGARSDDPLREFYDQVQRVFETRKPVVAAVQGAAIGAGLGLAVAADFRVAAPEARFSANFTRLGFHPGFGLTFTLPRLLGPQRAAQMFLTAERYRTDEVLHWGLVDRVVPAAELRAAALALAGEIAQNAPLALLSTRETLRGGVAVGVRDALAREHAQQLTLKDTADFAEGVRAMSERRAPRFEGR